MRAFEMIVYLLCENVKSVSLQFWISQPNLKHFRFFPRVDEYILFVVVNTLLNRLHPSFESSSLSEIKLTYASKRNYHSQLYIHTLEHLRDHTI